MSPDQQRGNAAREFDVVVWGASGFTGRLVAEHLFQVYGTGPRLRWAMAGRNLDKLETIRDDIGASSIPILIGDGEDPVSLQAIAARTRVVCTTVGPYLKFGEPMLATCVQTGTDYCDLTGEVLFIKRMLDRYGAEAKRNGARICNSCGFDSLPSDLGTLFMQQQFQARFGNYAKQIKCRVKYLSGAMSGGTVASMINIIDTLKDDPASRKIIADPYALNPADHQTGPDGRDQSGAEFDADLNAWSAPFVMAGINTRNVRRTNAVLGYPWGQDFSYTEAMRTGPGPGGRFRATVMSLGMKAFFVAASFQTSRRLMYRLFLPKPGEGPDEKARLEGSYKLLFFASDDAGNRLRGEVGGDRDPGYGSTSRMLGETAYCMARELDDKVGGGFLTAAALLDGVLIERLKANAGIEFRINE